MHSHYFVQVFNLHALEGSTGSRTLAVGRSDSLGRRNSRTAELVHQTVKHPLDIPRSFFHGHLISGYSRHPRGSSCRTMFLIGYTISYLLYTGFAAGITSLLALSGHRNRLSFDDVTSLRLKLLFHRDEYYFDFLEVIDVRIGDRVILLLFLRSNFVFRMVSKQRRPSPIT